MTESPNPPLRVNPRPAIVGGIVVIAITLGGIGGWAATAPLASAVIAPAVVVVDGKRKQVQHLEGGIVEKILIHDGAVVEAGQLLLRLDETRARATLGVMQTALDSALILESRLTAERDDLQDLNCPSRLLSRCDEPAVTAMLHAQRTLFDARRTSMTGHQSILRQRIVQHEKEIVGLQAQQAALEQQIALIEQELKGLRELLDKGLTPITKVLALERELARLNGSRGERIAEIAKSEITIGATKLEILQAERTFRENVVKEIRDVQTQIADLDERMTAARATLDHIGIRAPVAGTVVGLNAHTVGGVIKPGDVILEIVPGDQRLVVDAQVLPKDIDNVAVGMETEIRLTAFNRRTVMPLNGRVIYVSADSLTDPHTGAPFYLARAEIDPGEFARYSGQKLQPGMPSELLIKRRSRTALDYLVRPVADAMGRAWRED